MPATIADSSSGPERRVSRPITSRARSTPRSAWSVATSSRPTRKASSGVRGGSLATPRMPSVPNRPVTGATPPSRARGRAPSFLWMLSRVSIVERGPATVTTIGARGVTAGSTGAKRAGSRARGGREPGAQAGPERDAGPGQALLRDQLVEAAAQGALVDRRLDSAVDGQRGPPGLLGDDQGDRVGLLANAERGAMPAPEGAGDIGGPRERQEAAGGGDASAFDQHGAVVQRRVRQ